MGSEVFYKLDALMFFLPKLDMTVSACGDNKVSSGQHNIIGLDADIFVDIIKNDNNQPPNYYFRKIIQYTQLV